MIKVKLLKKRRIRRKRVIRKDIYGTNEKPRLSVFKSNKYIYIQAIDDNKGMTIVSASSLGQKKLNKEVAAKIGEDFGKKLLGKKIEKAVFDRNGFIYTGKIKSLADGIRKSGLKF